MPPLLAVCSPRLLTPVLEPSQILLCLLHLFSHLTRTSWQYIRLVSTNILLSVPRKEAIYAWWMDLVSPQKWIYWFSIWMQHFSEISLPLWHQHRLFSALWDFRTSIYAGWLQRVQRVGAHVLWHPTWLTLFLTCAGETTRHSPASTCHAAPWLISEEKHGCS